MARVVNAKHSTLIGTPKQLRELLRLLGGSGSAVVDLQFSNIFVLDSAVTGQQLGQALKISPKPSK